MRVIRPAGDALDREIKSGCHLAKRDGTCQSFVGNCYVATVSSSQYHTDMIALNTPPSDAEPSRPIFEPGQLVVHRRYGYRALVVKRDQKCMADEGWYSKNQTHPIREQPWYHLLVDGSTRCTYAASENLVLDPSGLPIDHPLIVHFFVGFDEGVYVRNDEPWPGWD